MHGAAEGECGTIAIKLIIKSKYLLSPLRMRKVFLIFLLLTTHFNSAMSAEPHHALTLIKNSIGMELIHVHPGEFFMGGQIPADEVLKLFPNTRERADVMADEYPQHRVRITKPFFLAKHEVTFGQFRQFITETGYKTEAEIDGTGGWGFNAVTRKSEGRNPMFNWMNTGYLQTDQHPVTNVSYNDALEFLQWLSLKEGVNYRLPTEAEWEYANRAGSQQLYSDSNLPADVPKFARAIDSHKHKEFAHVEDLEIDPDEEAAFPVPVGSYAPNVWGFHDMHGNVWEWVSDWHSETYYVESPIDDPQGPATGTTRVRRGGGWNSFPEWLSSSFRNINSPDSRCVNLGFRVVRDR